jgi:hypothetical protein
VTRTIRTLTLAETEVLVGWAAGEGWNPGIGDAAAFYAADPDGFLGAFAGSEMVAGISAVAYDEEYGFIGLFICRPDRRGEGHGRAVWDAAIARLADRTIGLDGVPALQARYAGMGFAKAYETIRLSGTPPSSGGTAVKVSADIWQAIMSFDGDCFPAPRAAFLRNWLSPPREAMAVLENGHLAGWGAVRPCIEGHKVGPLYARSGEVAVKVIDSLATLARGPVQVDVPKSQQQFVEHLTNAGMESGFSTARMYRGRLPELEQHCIFGISTLELG